MGIFLGLGVEGLCPSYNNALTLFVVDSNW